jgi:IS4 transposase
MHLRWCILLLLLLLLLLIYPVSSYTQLSILLLTHYDMFRRFIWSSSGLSPTLEYSYL